MAVERRGQVIRVMINLANWQQEEPTGCGGGRQLSMDGTSRVTGDCQARFREGLGAKFPGPTRPRRETPGADSAVPGNWHPYRDRTCFFSRLLIQNWNLAMI
jgi:hypothetical protein